MMELLEQELDYESIVSEVEIDFNIEETKLLCQRGFKLKLKNPDELEAA